ncbi:MAG: FG-GAP repeat domain-containing protein [Pyrinomonadaceae bacterium]
MRSSFAAFGKTALWAGLVALMAIPSLGQTKLRDASDYDGDDKADYAIFRPTNNRWYIKRSGGVIGQQEWGIANEDWMVPGDYDGDGKGDVAVWRETTGFWYRIMSATGTFTVHSWGVAGDEPVARDYDGDGKTDMAVVRRSGANMIWYVFFSSTNGFASRQFGVATDFTAPGDYNGDGKFDYAVQRPGPTPTSPATFYIQTATTYEVIQYGQSNDLVAPGDWDGDGKTDIAVVREGSTPASNLNWYVRQSSNGQTLGPYAWGVTGTDLLAQNDYTGDGKTDFAIWRNSNGNFYILNPVNNGISVVAWGQQNDFPIGSYDTH